MPHIAQQIQAKLETLDFRSLKWLLKEVSRCINQFTNFKGAFILPEESSALINICLKVCETVQQDKQTKMDSFHSKIKQMDEDEIDDFLE